jgi:glycosyltransferase involved in cell wall biosynthesis
VRRPRAVDWRAGSLRDCPRQLFRELDWKRWASYEQSVWRRFDRVQVFTQRDAASMRQIAPELEGRVRITPFGIEIPAPADPSQEDPATLLFAANFTHPPNVDAACWIARDVMPRVLAQRPDARLLIVGPFAPEEVRLLAAPNVDVTGAVPTIAPSIDRATVVLAPVRKGGGMRMKVLRALAAGKAVVTTPRGAEGFDLGGRPPLVIADAADEIARKTVLLLGDPERRAAMGAQARAHVATHYSAQAYGRRLEAVYEEVRLARQQEREAPS